MAEISVPPEVDELLKAYKRKKKGRRTKLTDAQWGEVRKYLATVSNVGEFLAKNYDYSSKDYGSIRNYFSSHKWPLGAKREIGRKPKRPKKKKVPTPEEIIEKTVAEKEREKATKIATDHMEDVYHLGNLVKSYGSKASEIGFHDDALDKPDLDKFTKTALDFFIKYRDKVQELEEKLMVVTATGRTVKKGYVAAVQRLRLVEMVIELIEETTPELVIDFSPLRRVIAGRAKELPEG